MKLTIIFLLAVCLQVSAKVRAQQMITLSQKDVSLETVFREIRKQTGYTFFCRVEWLQEAKKVNISVKNAPLQQVLDICFKDQPLTYTIVNKTIMVRPKAEEPKTSVEEAPPGIDLKGRVTNEKGEPLAGATVAIKGTSKGVSTDGDGYFELKQVNSGVSIVISFTGYAPREVRVSGGEFLPVRLVLSLNPMDETVVIAYGTTTKRMNPGDVTTVKAEDIEKSPVANPLAAIQGRVPGMFITQNTGAPNGQFTVQIRGKSSISSGTDPLYVIDGVPYASQMLPNTNVLGIGVGGSVGGNPLNFINPADIESIDVLKDADATAIYGSRAANGVVLITTKKGIAGAARVGINVYSGVGQIDRNMNWLDTRQYLQMRHEAFSNDGVTPTAANAPDLLVWDTTRYTDWQKVLIGGTAHYDDAQGTLSGGSANTQYLVGAGYHRESTVFPGSYSVQKGSLHFNLTTQSNNQRFKAVITGNYLLDVNNMPQADFTSLIPSLAPDAPPAYNPDGSLNWANGTWSNPFWYKYSTYNGRTDNVVGNALLSYTIVKGLQLKASLGYTNMQVNETSPTAIEANNPAFGGTTGYTYFVNNNMHSWIAEPQATYDIGGKWGNLKALFGASFQQNTSTGQYVEADGYTSDALLGNIAAASSLSINSITYTQYKYNAVFGRLNYNLQGKYILDLTARRDGSSRFGPGRQFANFGSVGAAWIFSDENFIKDRLPFLSFGKLRGSYGTSGNDQIGDYKYLDLYPSTQYPYEGVQGLYPNSLFNPDYSWEIDKKLEGGVELGVLKNRIMVEASYFRNRSSNMLLNEPLPSISGFVSIQANLPAIVQNTGAEFVLTTTNIRSKDFSWKTSLNLTIPKNKLVAYPGLASSGLASVDIIGQPLNVIQAYHWLGVNDSTGLYEFLSAKNVATTTPSAATDRIMKINPYPKYYGGFENSFRYKSIQLDVLFQFVKQRGIDYLFNYLPGYWTSISAYNQPTDVLGRWQKVGDQSGYQRFSTKTGPVSSGYGFAGQSDLVWGDASYARLKNLSLSWHLPEAWMKEIHWQEARIYLQGQNLLTITRYKGFDPEIPTNTRPSLPPLRVITAGIQVSF